jgi:ASC-1-like (ASCH) protein
MAIYEAGRESSILDDILIGDKRIECRLRRGKFAEYQVGDRVRLRRDIYRNGISVVELPGLKLQNSKTSERFEKCLKKLAFH